MAAAAAAATPAPPPETAGLPDYVTDPNAVLKDVAATWRFGKPPDYSKTRRYFEESACLPLHAIPPVPLDTFNKTPCVSLSNALAPTSGRAADHNQLTHSSLPARTRTHRPPDLPFLVENLVKNWEIEASFKTSLADWRTLADPATYTFAINGGEPQDAEHMLEVGTYNAIIRDGSEYYDGRYAGFEGSHKTFKRMMPTFAWEVLEVYSPPPVVSFRWRHWGVMKSDYVGYNNKAQKVTAPAHNRQISIQGVTVAHVDEAVRVKKLETWFDPMDMFRQIAPEGVTVFADEAEEVKLDEGVPVEEAGIRVEDPAAGSKAQRDVVLEGDGGEQQVVGRCPFHSMAPAENVG